MDFIIKILSWIFIAFCFLGLGAYLVGMIGGTFENFKSAFKSPKDNNKAKS